MFLPQEKSPLEKEIARVHEELITLNPKSDEYKVVMERYKELHKMWQDEQPRRISPDTVILCATNLVGMVLVIKHENFNVITSKAFGLIPKPR